MIHIHNFIPYFYVEAPFGFDTSPRNLDDLKNTLAQKTSHHRNIGVSKSPVLRIEVI
jgi:hypothetical protein